MSTRKITKYVDAVRDHRTLLAQREQHPDLADNLRHRRLLTDALAAVHTLRAGLTGSELGHAHRVLDRKEDVRATVARMTMSETHKAALVRAALAGDPGARFVVYAAARRQQQES